MPQQPPLRQLGPPQRLHERRCWKPRRKAIPNPAPEGELAGRSIVLGVSGGIAAYKSVELCRRLMDAGAQVAPILTQNALRFIGAATFDALASQPVRTTLWDSPEPSPHTDLGRWADLVVVAPATARLLASYANGLSDDLLATTLLATRAPVVVCPAMHTEMWEHPAVLSNVATLRSRGVTVIEPQEGALAGGDIGVGRLAEIPDIVRAIKAILNSTQDLAGKTVLVTAGGTREPLDPVRFLGNRSSGKQGHALAEVAADRGAKVILVTAAPIGTSAAIERVDVTTAQQMHDAVLEHLGAADIIVMAAAVADFRPNVAGTTKLKKTFGPPAIELVPTVDILSAIAERRSDDQIVIGFAAETDDLEANARDKLVRKKLDFIAANDVTQAGAGFEADSNRVLLLGKNGVRIETSVVSKEAVAAILFDQAAAAISSR